MTDIVPNCIDQSKTPLRDFQKEIVNFINNNDALLMVSGTGSGKTLTALTASICYLQKYPNNKIIVISPASLLGNFQKEYIKYAGAGQILPPNYSFYSFEKFLSLERKGHRVSCKDALIIIDEVHNLRNYEGYRVSAAMSCSRRSHKVLLLTATPFVNKYKDFFSLINLLNKKYIIGPTKIPKKFKKEGVRLPGIY